MKKLILLAILILFAGCATSNYGDPTRPDIRAEAKKVQKQNLKYYGKD